MMGIGMIWQFATSKLGIICIAVAAFLGTVLFYEVRIASIKGLHTIEVSGLQSDIAKKDLAAQALQMRDNACQFDLKFSLGKIDIQNNAIAKMGADADRRSADAKKSALTALRTKEDTDKLAAAGDSSPIGMNEFVLSVWGDGIP